MELGAAGSLWHERSPFADDRSRCSRRGLVQERPHDNRRHRDREAQQPQISLLSHLARRLPRMQALDEEADQRLVLLRNSRSTAAACCRRAASRSVLEGAQSSSPVPSQCSKNASPHPSPDVLRRIARSQFPQPLSQFVWSTRTGAATQLTAVRGVAVAEQIRVRRTLARRKNRRSEKEGRGWSFSVIHCCR